jgi:hypothetical protein
VSRFTGSGTAVQPAPGQQVSGVWAATLLTLDWPASLGFCP